MTAPASRPSLARKVTPADRQRKHDQVAGRALSVTVDGVGYVVREGDLSAADSAALRREMGMSFAGVLRAAATDPDIDLVAAIVWLARRAEGERALTFAEVAESIGYDAELDFGPTDGGEADSPEA